MYQIMLAVSIMTECQTLLHVSDYVSCEHNDRMLDSAPCIRYVSCEHNARMSDSGSCIRYVSIMAECQTLLHASDDVSYDHSDRMSDSVSCIR